VAPHLLLVEDSSLVTDALRVLFEQTGHRVTIARSVSEAVASATADPPDLMLLDLTLPDGDGLLALRALSEHGRAPRSTVAMTGHDDAATRQRCLDAGCRAVMVKPVPARELLRRVKEWL
jgi:DNA-binding response OmpR family regulator